MGLSSGSAAVESAYHTGSQDILEFVRQCALPDLHQVCVYRYMYKKQCIMKKGQSKHGLPKGPCTTREQ